MNANQISTINKSITLDLNIDKSLNHQFTLNFTLNKYSVFGICLSLGTLELEIPLYFCATKIIV
jgi:hypothetical protein